MTSELPQVASSDHSQSAFTSMRVSVDSAEQDAATATSMDRPGLHRQRTVAQCVVVASLASFVVGVVMTIASFVPLFYPPGQPPVIIITFQVLGPLMLVVAGSVWVVWVVLFHKWKKRMKRRERAARLRNRVQLHAFAIDVLKHRPQPADLLAPSNRYQLLEQLRLLYTCEKKRDSLLTKSNSAIITSNAKPSFDASYLKKSLSNVTYLAADEKNENNDQVVKENTVMPGNSSQQPDAMRLPGIFISNFDPSDVDECDGGSSYYEKEPRERCESYSAGGGTRCTLMVRRTGGGGGSSCSSSAGLFASQRSLPSSSKYSSRLGVGDSGWDGDVSHNASVSTISHRDWTGGLCDDPVERSVTNSASMNLFPPFNLNRRHSASFAEQKLGKPSTTTFSCQHEPVALRTDDRTTRFPSLKSKTTGRSSSVDDEALPQSLQVRRSQMPDVHLSISSSMSLTGIESAVLKMTVDDEDSETATRRRRSITTPIKRRPLRQRKAVNSRRAELTTIWINHHYHCHQHTDDSEVERRVERLLYEIDHSVTESVDESKIQSQEFEMQSD